MKPTKRPVPLRLMSPPLFPSTPAEETLSSVVVLERALLALALLEGEHVASPRLVRKSAKGTR